MENASINVLHIDTEFGWRGGQQQAAYLYENMLRNGLRTNFVCQPNSKFYQYCMDSELFCYPIRMRNEMDLLAGFKIAKICKHNNYNVLHLHSAHALAIGLLASLFYPGLKLVAVRRVDFHIKKNYLSQFKYNNRRINKIICISDGIKNVLLSDGIPDNKLITIHSGIDIHKFFDIITDEQFKTSLGIPKNHIIAGTIAAIVGHKDYPNLLKAAKIVIDKSDNISFVAVGDGTDEVKIYQLAKQLNLGDRFQFLGYQKDIGYILRNLDIFVLASKLEGMGTSILDAQSVGLPIIACNTGGIPEIVKHNENGLLVPPQNEAALAEAILQLANDEMQRRYLGKNGIENVKKFDIQITVQKNIELYKQILFQ